MGCLAISHTSKSVLMTQRDSPFHPTKKRGSNLSLLLGKGSLMAEQERHEYLFLFPPSTKKPFTTQYKELSLRSGSLPKTFLNSRREGFLNFHLFAIKVWGQPPLNSSALSPLPPKGRFLERNTRFYFHPFLKCLFRQHKQKELHTAPALLLHLNGVISANLLIVYYLLN